jgi:hypothetical protein
MGRGEASGCAESFILLRQVAERRIAPRLGIKKQFRPGGAEMKNLKTCDRRVRSGDFGTCFVWLAVICFGLFVPAFGAGATTRIITFDPPGSTRTWVTGVTSAGLIAGFYYDVNSATHGFTMDAAGNFTTFDAPGAGTGFDQGTFVEGISEGGEICGTYADSQSHDHGFLRDVSGTITTFDVSTALATFASSVNDSGQVAGDYYPNIYPYGYIGFIWTTSGPLTTFAPVKATYVESAKINALGEVAGWFESIEGRRGYYRDASGNITAFDASPSAATYVEAMNDSGAITGFFTDAVGYHGFVRQGKSIIQFDINGGGITEGQAINAGGTVAGWYTDANGASHAFTRDKLGNVTLIDVSYAGTRINQGTFATGINATGEVVGNFVGPAGNQHGWLRR